MSPVIEKVTLNMNEQKRLKVLEAVIVGHINGQQSKYFQSKRDRYISVMSE